MLSSGSCGFIEWCSGRTTGSALRKLAALLVEWEEGEPEDNGMRLPDKDNGMSFPGDSL